MPEALLLCSYFTAALCFRPPRVSPVRKNSPRPGDPSAPSVAKFYHKRCDPVPVIRPCPRQHLSSYSTIAIPFSPLPAMPGFSTYDSDKCPALFAYGPSPLPLVCVSPSARLPLFSVSSLAIDLICFVLCSRRVTSSPSTTRGGKVSFFPRRDVKLVLMSWTATPQPKSSIPL